MSKELYDPGQDPGYQEAVIDIDEWRFRRLPDGRELPYRYLHGEFPKKGVRFSYCFPKKEQFRGRFYQYLSPFPGPNEELASMERTGADDHIAFCLANGAYFVESNMGACEMFSSMPEPKMALKSSAAVAEFSRECAMEMYGCSRPYGYVYGGSGGGYKTMSCIENTRAWDGAVPYVIGSPVSLPNTITLHAQGQRCLRRVFGRIVDALDAGGSGDMYEGLNEDEAAMLKEITAMGFPPRAWFVEALGEISDGSLPVLTPGVKASDPQYFEDFWKVPGYLGADLKGAAARDRLVFSGRVKCVHVPGDRKGECPPEADNSQADRGGSEAEAPRIDDRNGVDSAWQKMLADGTGSWIELEEAPKGELYLRGVTVTIESGEAAGRKLLLGDLVEGRLVIGMCYGMDDMAEVLSVIRPGDQVTLDNSDYIAIQSYYRHQVPEDVSFTAWDQFRDGDGRPTLPQRPNVMGYHMTGTGTVQDGQIQGKVIVIQALTDESTCPWCGDWYRKKVTEAKGSEEDFRIYYMDNCMHGDSYSLGNTRVVNYMGALRQALLDLSDWVERGIEPLPSTEYRLLDGQIQIPDPAGERKGIQPVVTLFANGRACAHVKTGEPVTFTARAQAPEGAGEVTEIRFGFSDSTTLTDEEAFPEKGMLRCRKKGGAESETTHVYEKPGVYFAAARVQANRHGDGAEAFTQVQNLARARIIVEA